MKSYTKSLRYNHSKPCEFFALARQKQRRQALNSQDNEMGIFLVFLTQNILYYSKNSSLRP
jgi:hypothetical protein